MKNRNIHYRFSFSALLTMLVLASPIMHADTTSEPDVGDGWGEWKALGNGYVARRKEPTQAKQQSADKAHSKVRSLPSNVIQKSGKDKPEKLDGLWFRTREDGLYRVSIDELAAELGEPVDKLREKAGEGTYSLTNAGESVSLYFDATEDGFLFVGEAFDSFYSENNAYKFAADHKKARPMGLTNAVTIAGLGEEYSFRETLKFEEEPDYLFVTWAVASEPEADYWFWDYLQAGYRDSLEVELEAPNPAGSGTAQIRVRLRGSSELKAGDDHHVYAELNGEQVGETLSWDGFDEVVLVAGFDQSLLKQDGKNILRLRNIYSPGEHPLQWLDDIELSYERMPIAENGMLWLHDAAGGTQTVSGFSDNGILVIESPVGTSVMRKDILVESDSHGAWQVTFDTRAGLDYLVVEAGALQTPGLAPAIQSEINKLSIHTEYLIIASREFEATAQSLQAYRKNRFKHTKVIWLDEIYANFNDGRVDPLAITRFMEWAKSQRINPSYVTLIGKGTVDQKDRMEYGDSFLPIRMASTPWSLAASDRRLLAGDSEVSFAIGRLPITSDSEGLAYIKKLAEYESSIPGMERFEAVLVADNPDDAGEFHLNSDALSLRLLDTMEFDRVTTLYHPQDMVRTSLIDSATWETGYVSYDGHGSAAQVGDYKERFILSADADLLTNYSYPVFTALSCATGNYALPGVRSLASALVLNPAGGAIASFAPTGLSLDDDAQLLGNAFVDGFFMRNSTIGDAVRDAMEEVAAEISPFMLPIYSVVGEPAIYSREY